MKQDILFAENNKYRYKILYEWDSTLPKVLFIMFNPTKRLVPNQPGPTSKVVIDYAKKNGYGGVYIGNVFAYVSVNPLKVIQFNAQGIDVVGKENDKYLLEMAIKSQEVIFAWGSYIKYFPLREDQIFELLPRGNGVSYNKDHTPCHPLSSNFKY